MRTKNREWIDLLEKQTQSRLNEGDPFFGRTATSSPSGGTSCSIPQFREHMDFLRERLACLLRHMACEKSNGSHHGLEARAELLAVCSDFVRARKSAQGWQDIHAADLDLVQRAEKYL